MFLPFLKNPFYNKRTARKEFLDLMDGNIDRMTGLNGTGLYTAMIADLTPHRDGYRKFLSGQDLNLGERYGDTDDVEKVLTDFKAFAKDELLVDVAYLFGRKTPNNDALVAFLPAGKKEYSGATLGTLPTLLDRVVALTATYKDDLGPVLVKKAADLKKAYTEARKTQGESKGEVQGDSKQEKKLRKAAARQLKLGLLDQVKMHIDEPDTVKALYDAKIFTQPKKGTKPGMA